MTTPLYRASVALYRACECDRIGPVRAQFLREASGALNAADFPEWAARAERAADSIGGNVGDVDRLLFEVDCAVSRQRHAMEVAA